MENSSQDVIESSQKCKKPGRWLRTRVSAISATKIRRSQRISRAKITKALESQTDTPTSSAEEYSANVSGSLFDGQQEVLKQYRDHDQVLKQYDVVLEEVLEQSRKAYEKMQLQSASRDVFSVEAIEMSKKRDDTNGNNLSGQIASQNEEINSVPNRKDVAVQVDSMESKPCALSVQAVPTEKCYNQRKTSTVSTNTEQISFKDASNQTNRVESHDVGVQKYHSTRCREASVQAMIGKPLRITAKRNVCIQRSSRSLDLNSECALYLAEQLKCDPARLLWLMLQTAAKQNSLNDESLRSTQLSVEFSNEDPYFVSAFLSAENSHGSSFANQLARVLVRRDRARTGVRKFFHLSFRSAGHCRFLYIGRFHG